MEGEKNMNWKTIPLGPLQTNCYVIWNQKNEALVIDPGGDGDRLKQWLNSEKLTPSAILLTHAHFDHIGAVDEIRNAYSIPVYIHKKENDWLSNPQKNGSAKYPIVPDMYLKPADHTFSEEGKVNIGSFSFELYKTPGHSPGSVSFYFKNEAVVFSGDALFSGSIGRTDLFGGNHDTLLQSIHDKLLQLPEETTVASGHGPLTTIGIEMDSNPFLNGF
jgi:hydroxyacylglutathione hydrolase